MVHGFNNFYSSYDVFGMFTMTIIITMMVFSGFTSVYESVIFRFVSSSGVWLLFYGLLALLVCFTSSVRFTGSYTEDEAPLLYSFSSLNWRFQIIAISSLLH